ncbi:AGC protein kinase [Puccinia sorghi]|uniref:AGC protein kinase n=1 Tax=Puccinia sorghi TaxID=27349 RepID=A0A0L6VIE3_9BASI|nr:AGC protein kinase [Puccinia sorghi]
MAIISWFHNSPKAPAHRIAMSLFLSMNWPLSLVLSEAQEGLVCKLSSQTVQTGSIRSLRLILKFNQLPVLATAKPNSTSAPGENSLPSFLMHTIHQHSNSPSSSKLIRMLKKIDYWVGTQDWPFGTTTTPCCSPRQNLTRALVIPTNFSLSPAASSLHHQQCISVNPLDLSEIH